MQIMGPTDDNPYEDVMISEKNEKNIIVWFLSIRSNRFRPGPTVLIYHDHIITWDDMEFMRFST